MYVENPQISIVMGSKSDFPIMKQAEEIIQLLGIRYEITLVSAHRTPERMFDYAKTAHSRGIKVIIAGAGGAAHLPGMIASLTPLPVIGVPIHSRNSMDGWDSVLSILQMPNGIPVATVALDAARNAGLLAARMIGATEERIQKRLIAYLEDLKEDVLEDVDDLNRHHPNAYDAPST